MKRDFNTYAKKEEDPMNQIYDNWSLWQKLLTMLENQFGTKSEFILHDLTKDYNLSLIHI